MRSSKILVAIVVVAIAGAFLGFTTSGHRMLYKLGFTAACGSSDCDNG